MENIEKARQFALERHKGQTYGDEPYSVHLNAVVSNVERYSHELEDYFWDGVYEGCIVIAWLHDTLEDTNTTLEELEKEFGSDIANYVSILSHRQGENYSDYIERILEDDVCSIIKHADLSANIDAKDAGDGYCRQRKDKYRIARKLIEHVMLYESDFEFNRQSQKENPVLSFAENLTKNQVMPDPEATQILNENVWEIV